MTGRNDKKSLLYVLYVVSISSFIELIFSSLAHRRVAYYIKRPLILFILITFIYDKKILRLQLLLKLLIIIINYFINNIRKIINIKECSCKSVKC